MGFHVSGASPTAERAAFIGASHAFSSAPPSPPPLLLLALPPLVLELLLVLEPPLEAPPPVPPPFDPLPPLVPVPICAAASVVAPEGDVPPLEHADAAATTDIIDAPRRRRPIDWHPMKTAYTRKHGPPRLSKLARRSGLYRRGRRDSLR
jgi:hypothetical protein